MKTQNIVYIAFIVNSKNILDYATSNYDTMYKSNKTSSVKVTTASALLSYAFLFLA